VLLVGDLCDRPYVVNLLPCLLRINQRPEELVHETLAGAMSKISPVLTSFMTDMETKVHHFDFYNLLFLKSFQIAELAYYCLSGFHLRVFTVLYWLLQIKSYNLN